jgi:hypothetical protein
VRHQLLNQSVWDRTGGGEALLEVIEDLIFEGCGHLDLLGAATPIIAESVALLATTGGATTPAVIVRRKGWAVLLI